MTRAKSLALLGIPAAGALGGGGFTLPFTDSFDTDGALAAPWSGSTFAASGGIVSNTPTTGSELLTDASLEANYTAGKCDTLTLNGSPTLTESADAHAGSKAQQFECTATNQWVRFPQFAATPGTWYRCSVWSKLVAGAASADFKTIFTQAAAFPSGGAGFGGLINQAAYTKKQTSFLANSTGNIATYAVSAFATSRTGIVDDFSVKALTYADIFAMVNIAGQRTETVKIQPNTIADNTISGVICWANATASPDTFVMATINRRISETILEIGLMKFVSGSPTQLINPTATAAVADAWLEIRPVDGTTVALYYNDTQIGSNQAVADVPGVYGGMMVTGGNNIKSFFMG